MPNEQKFAEGLMNLDKHGSKVDFIVSHDCPSSIQEKISGGMYEKRRFTKYLEEVRRRPILRYGSSVIIMTIKRFPSITMTEDTRSCMSRS
jgi:hypothetical protein